MSAFRSVDHKSDSDIDELGYDHRTELSSSPDCSGDGDWRIDASIFAPSCCGGSSVASTPASLIPAVLAMARFQPGDVFIDLGCGSGKIAVAAAMTADIRAIGMEANPFCLARCVSLFASFRPRFKPHATVEWSSRDISTLQWTDVCAYAHPQRVVVYAYLGASQLAKLRPLVAMLLCAGARVITYDTHFVDIDNSEDVLVEKKYGELLRMRQVIRPRTDSSLSGGFLLTPSKLRASDASDDSRRSDATDGKPKSAKERLQDRKKPQRPKDPSVTTASAGGPLIVDATHRVTKVTPKQREIKSGLPRPPPVPGHGRRGSVAASLPVSPGTRKLVKA